MHHHYKSITDRIDAEPLWFDENGVPRYDPFKPNMSAYIYADEVALLLIACQRCQTEFKVCMTSGVMGPKLSNRIDDLHYGDPPNMGCCPAGPTMNSEPKKILEFWVREDLDWVKKDELTGHDITPDWAD